MVKKNDEENTISDSNDNFGIKISGGTGNVVTELSPTKYPSVVTALLQGANG
jgi:hypothetical protein